MTWWTNDATGGMSTATAGTLVWLCGLNNPAITPIAINELVVIFTLIPYATTICSTHNRLYTDYDMLYYNVIELKNPKDVSVHKTQSVCPP